MISRREMLDIPQDLMVAGGECHDSCRKVS